MAKAIDRASRNNDAGPSKEPVTANVRSIEEGQAPDPERVAERAYERFQMRGGQHGRHEEDWFEAERQLRGAASD
jgi:hypothetical protein